MGAIRKTRNAQCKFSSILVCMYFYVQNTFPTFCKVAWKTKIYIEVKIGEFIEQLGENCEFVMTSYFEDFKKSMKKRSRIHVCLVEQHYNDFCFLVDANFTYFQVVIPRVR